MSDNEPIAGARYGAGVLDGETYWTAAESVRAVCDALEAAERDLAAAQAVIAEVRALSERMHVSASRQALVGILALSPADALQAHDREVAAKALTDLASEWDEWYSAEIFSALNAADHEMVTAAIHDHTEVSRDAVSADVFRRASAQLRARAAAIVSVPSAPGNGYVSNSTPWWAQPSTPEQEEER